MRSFRPQDQQTVLKGGHQLLSPLHHSAGSRDAANIGPNVRKRVGLKRDNNRRRIRQGAESTLDVVERDSTDFALPLGDDVGRTQTLEQVIENVVDGSGFREGVPDQTVDLGACTVHGELWARADRQVRYARREIALMGTADLVVSQTEGVKDLRGAGDQRDDAEHQGLKAPE